MNVKQAGLLAALAVALGTVAVVAFVIGALR